MEERLSALLRSQGYKPVGEGSAVKLCSWLRKSIKGEGECYKSKFYGITTHRCLQCTPAVVWCNHRCEFCWRSFSWLKGTKMSVYDPPEKLLDLMIEAQRLLITGFKGNPLVSDERFLEAWNPKHVAISLSGEPTLYPELGGFIKSCHAKRMTTFLVTNGTNPDVLLGLEEQPTQLYVTLPAPNKEVYLRTCKPLIRDGWERIMRALEILRDVKTRKVIRLTLVKDLNFVEPEGYADLFLKSGADFLEVKGFMSVGDARKKLGYELMPSFAEIKEFSERICEHAGLKIIDEAFESNVTLIAKKDPSWRKIRTP